MRQEVPTWVAVVIVIVVVVIVALVYWRFTSPRRTSEVGGQMTVTAPPPGVPGGAGQPSPQTPVTPPGGR